MNFKILKCRGESLQVLFLGPASPPRARFKFRWIYPPSTSWLVIQRRNCSERELGKKRPWGKMSPVFSPEVIGHNYEESTTGMDIYVPCSLSISFGGGSFTMFLFNSISQTGKLHASQFSLWMPSGWRAKPYILVFSLLDLTIVFFPISHLWRKFWRTSRLRSFVS